MLQAALLYSEESIIRRTTTVTAVTVVVSFRCVFRQEKILDKIRILPYNNCNNKIVERGMTMMYPYMTLNDDTEIVHSEMMKDGRVKVYIETPDLKDGFHNATCYLPDYTWEDIKGYSDAEMDYFKQLIRDNAHLIIEFSKEGGILNASNF